MSKAFKALNRHHEDNRAADGHLDGAGNERSRRRGLKRHDIDELVSGLAVLGDDLQEVLHFIVLNTDHDGGVALAQKATGRTDDRELEPGLDQFVRDLGFVAAVDNAEDQLHRAISITETR